LEAHLFSEHLPCLLLCLRIILLRLGSHRPILRWRFLIFIGTKPVAAQDAVQREDACLNYKENEFNLFCYSADRNWVVNTGENRYNFSVTFNAGNAVGQDFRKSDELLK
jgi:hypothetical protein